MLVKDAICTCVTFVAVFMHERAYELMVRISHRTTHRIAQLPLFAQTQARCQSLLAVISTLYLCAKLRQQRASVHRSMAGTCAPSVCLHGGLSEVAERRGRAYILNHEWLQCEHCVAHAVFRTFTRHMVTRTKRHVILQKGRYEKHGLAPNYLVSVCNNIPNNDLEIHPQAQEVRPIRVVIGFVQSLLLWCLFFLRVPTTPLRRLCH